MDTPRATGSQDADSDTPGVQPRQVYVYRRWHPDAEQAPASHQRPVRSSSRPGPPLDTVEPGDKPVLSGYQGPTGAGRTVDDSGGESSRSPAPAEARDVQNVDLEGLETADISAEFVYTTLAINDIELDEAAEKNVPTLYRECRTEGDVFHNDKPSIGDLVFFHNTYDANDDGRNNDWYSLVGIIENITSDGTIEFLTHRGGDVESHRMNLEQLDQHESSSGRVLNSQLRQDASDDPPYTHYLAGQLFAGFCNILGDRNQLILMDHWAPGLDI